MSAKPRQIHDVVSTRIAVLAATAQARVAALESSERQTPALSGTSNARLAIARRITETRAISASWNEVLRFVTDLDDLVPPSPSASAPAGLHPRILTLADAEAVIVKSFNAAPRKDPGYAEGWNDALSYLRTALGHVR